MQRLAISTTTEGSRATNTQGSSSTTFPCLLPASVSCFIFHFVFIFQKCCSPLWSFCVLYLYVLPVTICFYVSSESSCEYVHLRSVSLFIFHFAFSFHKFCSPLWYFCVLSFICFTNYIVSMRTVKALVNMCICAGSPQPSLLENMLKHRILMC